MTLPAQMANRWHHRTEPAPGHGTVYWHMLMRDQPQVTELVRQAQQQLAPFAAGLHMTPATWLHMTTLVAGPAARFTDDQLKQLTANATQLLAGTPPITVTLGRVLYHPEAIMLGVTPEEALHPIHEAAVQATREVTQEPKDYDGKQQWTPHITICYSIADQPAGPIINTLGLRLPRCDIEISALQLVIQHGPERDWDWSVLDTIRLAQASE